MRTPYTKTAVLAALCMIAFSGCPMQGSPVVGTWAVELDFDCDETDSAWYLIALYSNGTVELLGALLYAGTWEFTGSTITIDLPNVQGTEWEMTGTLGTNTISAGTFTVDGMGDNCWNAVRTSS
jgi:hypothetical protein